MGVGVSAGTLLVAAAAALAIGCGGRAPSYPTVAIVGSAVRLPLEEVADGRVHFYSWEESGTRVNFLVRTDGKGVLHTHLDACYSCYHYRRGFIVEDNDLVCIACRYEYPIEDEAWDFIGACAPISIHSKVEAGRLVIPRRVLEQAVRYF